MAGSARELLLERIRSDGPITVADFMDVALYHPEHGYYATARRRSGRGGDFYTSVDVGPLFGETISVQIAGMWQILRSSESSTLDLVEAGAGDGRLMRDVLDSLARDFPSVYDRARVTLVERSRAAREAQPATLGPHARRVAAFACELPARIHGVLFANELLDALPVHAVRFSDRRAEEIYVGEHQGQFRELTGPVSDARISAYIERYLKPAETGCRAEAGLSAIEWIVRAAGTLEQGFILLFDYLIDGSRIGLHPEGTLTAFRQHALDADWLNSPGESDLTSHVNLSAIRDVAETNGLEFLGAIDQSYFLINLGLLERVSATPDLTALKGRIAARSLLAPGGLGTTMKTIAFAKAVGRPSLQGFSAGRLT